MEIRTILWKYVSQTAGIGRRGPDRIESFHISSYIFLNEVHGAPLGFTVPSRDACGKLWIPFGEVFGVPLWGSF